MQNSKLKLENKNPEDKAYDYAVYLLSLKLRTEGELREKLRIKNYKLEIVDLVISKLKESRYLDDQQYAEVYVDNLKKYKTFGFYGIKKKLMEKRLPSEIIESVLSESLSEAEELKIAKRFLKKTDLETLGYHEKQKLAAKLKNRGFRSAVTLASLGF